MPFAKNMGKNSGKNIIKNCSGKYSQKLLDHAKQSATDEFKTASKKSNPKNNRSNWLDNTPSQPTKFRTKNWVEINDDARGTYSTNSQIKFQTSMLKSGLCDYSDAYILVSGTITGNGDNDTVKRADEREKGVIFKNCAPFIDCISEINNTQIDNAKI